MMSAKALHWSASSSLNPPWTAVCQPGCKHGDCVGPNKCKCHPGFTGKTCNQGELLPRTCRLNEKQLLLCGCMGPFYLPFLTEIETYTTKEEGESECAWPPWAYHDSKSSEATHRPVDMHIFHMKNKWRETPALSNDRLITVYCGQIFTAKHQHIWVVTYSSSGNLFATSQQ